MGTTRQKSSCRNRLQNGPHSLLRMKVGTHTRLCQQDRTQRLTRRNRGCFGWGRYYYPRSVSHISETLRGQVSERQTLPLLRLDPVCSRRTQRAFGTATRISASLSRRLSVSFWSTPDQGPKAAKFAVLTPGHAGFPDRAKRSEGRDSAPIRNSPCFGVWAVVCDSLSRAGCVPTFACESKRGPFVGEVEKCDEKRFGTALWQ